MTISRTNCGAEPKHLCHSSLLAIVMAPILLLAIPPSCDGSPEDGAPSLAIAPLSEVQTLPTGAAILEYTSGPEGSEEARGVPGSLMFLPREALQELVGAGVSGDLLIEQRSEDGPTTVRQRLVQLHDLEVDEPNPVSADSRSSVARLGDDVRDSLHVQEFLVDELGRLLVYARFWPEVPPDAALRVDWSSVEHRLRPRSALLEGERLRQAELELRAVTNENWLATESGCEWVHRASASNAAFLWCESSELDILRSASRVESATPVLRPILTHRGDDSRAATGLQHGHLITAGFDGDTPDPASSRTRVEIALVDWEGFGRNHLHPAYQNTNGGPSRVTRRRICGATCADFTLDQMGYDNAHGAVTMGSLQDVLDGQDPPLSGPAREDRSYGAHEAELEFYMPISIAPAISDAASTDQGVDIIAVNAQAGSCGEPATVAPERDAWNLAYALGAIGVTAAGNGVNRTNDACTANGFATRPEIVVVGGSGDDTTAPSADMINTFETPAFITPMTGWTLDTDPLMGWHWTDSSFANNCPDAPAPQTTCWSSAMGGANVRSNGTVFSSAWNVIDVITPAGRELSAYYSGGAPAYLNVSGGTSHAVFEGAAVLASVLDFGYSAGLANFQTPGIPALLMNLMGDGTRGFQYTTGTGPTAYSGNHNLWGSGRLRARYFNEAGMDGPWGLDTGFFNITHGQRFDFLLGSGPMTDPDVNFLRAGISWFEPNISATSGTDAANIIVRIVRTPPSGGSCVNPNGTGGVIVRSDVSLSFEKILKLSSAEFASMVGNCVWLRVEALFVPTASFRTVYRAAYWEDLDRETAENLNGIN